LLSSNNVLVLGITDGHNAGACLIKNGVVLSAISEERLSRIKNEAGYPKNAIKKVLELAQIEPEDITIIALAGKFSHKKEFYSRWNWYKVGKEEQEKSKQNKNQMSQIIESRLNERKNDIIKDLNISEQKIVVVEHHLSHAASAYYASPWINSDKVLVLTCDGSGDGLCSTVSIGESGKISRIGETKNNASVGKIYSRITLLLGMKPWEHEYKIMGLAPYADENGVKKSYDVLEKLIEIPGDSIEFKTKTDLSTNYCYNYLKTELENHRFDWIAGGIQKLTEEIIVKWVKNAIKKTGLKKIVCAGGVFMNVKANMKISELEEVEDIFVFPSGGDESLAIGAALNAYAEYVREIGESVNTQALGQIYLGPEFSNEEIEDAIKSAQLDSRYSVENIQDIDEFTAETLAKGDIVARFSGRMEWGARALGNRSILADPSGFEKIREINLAIKQRDFWMPFAPSIISEKQDELISNPKNLKAPYMVMGFNTKERSQKDLISAIHAYDFTARPQLLEKEYNENYYNLITRFDEIVGIPAVLNTSFNLHGSPIVCKPMDAIDTLQKSGLRCLAIGNYFIRKK